MSMSLHSCLSDQICHDSADSDQEKLAVEVLDEVALRASSRLLQVSPRYSGENVLVTVGTCATAACVLVYTFIVSVCLLLYVQSIAACEHTST